MCCSCGCEFAIGIGDTHHFLEFGNVAFWNTYKADGNSTLSSTIIAKAPIVVVIDATETMPAIIQFFIRFLTSGKPSGI